MFFRILPEVVEASVITRTHSTAITQADTRDRVVSEACQSSTVVNCGDVIEESIAVPPTVGIFVLSMSVNHPLVTRVAVAPIVVTKRFAHFFKVVPKSSVLSVSDTREVLIATESRLSRAVDAPPHETVSNVGAEVAPLLCNTFPDTQRGTAEIMPELFLYTIELLASAQSSSTDIISEAVSCDSVRAIF